MDIKAEFINLAVDDGSSMRSYVARPAGKARAGLIVFPEIFGINSHIRSVTERFGREGYLAIAPELPTAVPLFASVNETAWNAESLPLY